MYEHTINTFLRVNDGECLPHITNPSHVLETGKACNSGKKGPKRQGFRQDIKKSELAPVHSRCNTEIRGEDTFKVLRASNSSLNSITSQKKQKSRVGVKIKYFHILSSQSFTLHVFFHSRTKEIVLHPKPWIKEIREPADKT